MKKVVQELGLLNTNLVPSFARSFAPSIC